MIKNIKNKYGFTLIELIVAVTILSIIMISVFSAFVLSADINNKVDISRSMQENIKNLIEIISEDIRKNGISGVNNDFNSNDCGLPASTEMYKIGTKLCVGHNNNSYYLAKKVGENDWIRVYNYDTDCGFGKENCFLVKNASGLIHPISNSWVNFRELYFYLSKDNQPAKVSINFILQPSSKKGIKPELIKENEIIFQTTISSRLYNE